jgi:hypothetical protein
MVEQSLIEQFFASVGHSPWSVVIGIALLILVAVVRFVFKGRTKGAATEWVSASSAVVLFIAGALVSGGLWYVAVAVGLLASPGSEGFWRLVRKAVPVIGATLALLLLAGCGAGPIVPDPDPGDDIEPCEVEGALVDSLATAVDDVDDAVPDDAPKAVDGLAYARGVVEAGRAAVGTCQALTAEGRSGLSAVLPWLSAASSMVRAIISIIMAAHVDIPESVRDVLHMLGLARATLPPIERDSPYTPAYYDVAVAR